MADRTLAFFSEMLVDDEPVGRPPEYIVEELASKIAYSPAQFLDLEDGKVVAHLVIEVGRRVRSRQDVECEDSHLLV